MEELTGRIASGQLPPGTLLPSEIQLAAEFGVSRIVIRETVKVLVTKGLLDVRQGRGTTVRPESAWNVLDPMVLRFKQQDGDTSRLYGELLEARGIFEVQIVALAATRISDGELSLLSMHLRRMDTVTGDVDAYHAADAEFHLMIIRAAQNRVLAALIEPVRALLEEALRDTVALPGSAHRAQVLHWNIFRALERHDRSAATEAMHGHLDQAAKDLMTVSAKKSGKREPRQPSPHHVRSEDALQDSLAISGQSLPGVPSLHTTLHNDADEVKQ